MVHASVDPASPSASLLTTELPLMSFQVRLRDGTPVTVDTIGTKNKNKLAEYKSAGLILKTLPETEKEPEEPQASNRHYELLNNPTLENCIKVATEIAIAKAINYQKFWGFPVAVDDASLFAKAAPAQTSINIKTWVMDHVGPNGPDVHAGQKKLIKLVDDFGDRRAYAIACLAISNGTSAQAWYGVVEGTIAPELSKGKYGFDWDKFFQPILPASHAQFQGQTWADLPNEFKMAVTPFRSAAASALLKSSIDFL